MAVQTNLAKSALNLKYVAGLDESGKEVFKTKKFSNVKVSATNQSIFDVSQAFSPLMKYPVVEVLRTDDNVLYNL